MFSAKMPSSPRMRLGRRQFLKASVASSGLFLAGGAKLSSVLQDPGDLAAAFLNPPAAARPRVWWHWVNGNVSHEGVLADLAWMKRVGIGGFTLFDAAFRSPPTPVVVKQPVIFHSQEWREIVGATAAEAARLDLDFGVHISGGWSESGGPWIQPQQAMKKLVWSETIVEDGRSLDAPLPSPPDASGPFLDYPIAADHAEPRLYRDVAVIAFPQPQFDRPAEFTMSSNAGEVDADGLTSGRYGRASAFAPPAGEPLVITLRYLRPTLISAVTVSGSPGVPNGYIEVSEDGLTFDRVTSLPGPAEKGSPVRTFGFNPLNVRSVRVVMEAGSGGRVVLRQLAAHSDARINRYEDKSGLGTLADYSEVATAKGQEGAVDPATVLDLTSRLRSDGRLDWTPPSGSWVVQRFGYSLTGRRNVPATPAATGLEADKLNAEHVRAHLHGFFGPLLEAVGPHRGDRGLRHAIIDSWEAGQQNWTEAMPEAFRARRGYDLTSFLPALSGRVVGDAETSDRFLWDFRATIGDLLADNHYAVIRDFLHERGLYVYGESMGIDLPTLGDGLRLKGLADIPTGEFWARTGNAPPLPTHIADIREAASAAHIYGKTLVAAEAFTTFDEVLAWSMGPRELRPVADRFMAEGVNRFIIHTSAHQPFLDQGPGITLRRYGQHFTRHEAWAEMAGGWLDYLARSSVMLQQGRSVADVAIFYGEGAPVSVPFRDDLLVDVPQGYAHDYVNAEVLDLAVFRDGWIELAGGARYRLLVVPPRFKQLSERVVKAIARLVMAGATVLAEQPEGPPGQLPADADGALIDRVWASLKGRSGPNSGLHDHAGHGQILSGQTVLQALQTLGVPPAIDWPSDRSLHWCQRHTEGEDIYFIANPIGAPILTDLSLRSLEGIPEVWNAVDAGRSTPVWNRSGSRTHIRLDLPGGEARFVVLRRAQRLQDVIVQERDHANSGHNQMAHRIEGPWTVRFQPMRGAPAGIALDTLQSWTTHSDFGVRHFSGIATYTTHFKLEEPGAGQTMLDLGDVREIAEVRLNGQDLGNLWAPPFLLDVTNVLVPGENTLEVRVANYWQNRLIGDLQTGVAPVAFTTVSYYSSDTPLRVSGLLGPVRIWRTGLPSNLQ